MRVPLHVAIWRQAERGVDLVTLLQMADARDRRRVLNRLYTKVPRSLNRWYRQLEAEGEKDRAEEREKLLAACEAVLGDPESPEEAKRLARIEIFGRTYVPYEEDYEDDDEEPASCEILDDEEELAS